MSHSFHPTIPYKRAKMAKHVVIESFPNCVGKLFKDIETWEGDQVRP